MLHSLFMCFLTAVPRVVFEIILHFGRCQAVTTFAPNKWNDFVLLFNIQLMGDKSNAAEGKLTLNLPKYYITDALCWLLPKQRPL